MIKAIRYVLYEHFANAGRIWKLAIEFARRQVIRTTLGMGWIIFRDLVYFVAFILVRFLLAGNRQADGINFIAYLMVGLATWFFMNDVINASPNSIKGNKSIIDSFSFPISVLSTIDVVAVFIKRFFTLLIIFLVVWGYGYISYVKPWLFIYYFFAMFTMMVAFNLVFSAINAISRDFAQLYESFTRILIYSVPIIWSFDQIIDVRWAVVALKVNPFTYVLIGVRSALLGGTPNGWGYTVYFWSVLLMLFSSGSFLQFKLRKYFADYL